MTGAQKLTIEMDKVIKKRTFMDDATLTKEAEAIIDSDLSAEKVGDTEKTYTKDELIDIITAFGIGDRMSVKEVKEEYPRLFESCRKIVVANLNT